MQSCLAVLITKSYGCILDQHAFLRKFSCIIIAVVYHPPGADEHSMKDHLFWSLRMAESKFLNCALIVSRDFNRLNVNQIERHFRPKQIVQTPTRRNAILDIILTNIDEYYNTTQISTPPPVGYPTACNTITVSTKNRIKDSTSTTITLKRSINTSSKPTLGR